MEKPNCRKLNQAKCAHGDKWSSLFVIFYSTKTSYHFPGFFRLPRRFPATADLDADQARRGVLPGAAMLINQGILTKGEGSVQLTSSLR